MVNKLCLLCKLLTTLNDRIKAEGPDLDPEWSKQIAMVMRNGRLDMRSWQKVVETMEKEPEEASPEVGSLTDTTNSYQKRFVIDKYELKWTHAIIPFVFDGSVSSRTRSHIEKDIFGLYEYWTHFRFVPWNSSVPEVYQLGHDNYLIFVESNSACGSYTGNNRNLRGQQISCCKYDRCIHELGHAIGFIHEISSPLRDDYIRINLENIQKDKEPNFERISEDRTFGYYDMSSVMGYSVDARSVPNNNDACSNGGYLSYVNGTCRCRCPHGLDYRHGCTVIDVETADCGEVIELSKSTKAVNISSPSYPMLSSPRSTCVWFIKGPIGSRIALDFSDFYIPEDDSTGSCSTFLEIRFIMPGQPGVNVTWMDLEDNYCRNPGHGTGPWCYTNANTCERVYCDVCQIRRCYDIFDDCDAQIKQNPAYCQRNPEANRGCRHTCGLCSFVQKPKAVSAMRCMIPPPTLLDGELISDNKLVYNVGETATYRCNRYNTTRERNITCTAQGTWSYLGYICNDTVTCADQRLDCSNLLERNPTLCIDHRDFAQLKCANTCSLCTHSNDVQEIKPCSFLSVSRNVTEVSRVGNIIHYACLQNYVLVAGQLTRTCTKNGTYTGQQPICLAEEDSITDIYEVDVRRRKHATSSYMMVTFSHENYIIKRRGQIVAWQFYSLYSGKVTFQVWRRAGTTNSYKLLGTFDVEETLEDRLVTVHVPDNQKISVEPGDFIGFQTDSSKPGGISYDRCLTEYNPEGGGQLKPETSGPLTAGQYYTLRPWNTCWLVSVTAKIGPPKKVDLVALQNAWRNFVNFHRNGS